MPLPFSTKEPFRMWAFYWLFFQIAVIEDVGKAGKKMYEKGIIQYD